MFLNLLAQAAEATSTATGTGTKTTASGVSTLIFFALIIGAFYFLMIRPQRARARAHQEMVRAIEVGDEVETAGGMFGKVVRETEDVMWIEVIQGQPPVKMARAAIRRRVIDTGDRT